MIQGSTSCRNFVEFEQKEKVQGRVVTRTVSVWSARLMIALSLM